MYSLLLFALFLQKYMSSSSFALVHYVHVNVVTNEPSINRDLEPDDKFVIIASDGVFEFLTNQMVAGECALHSDPLAACKAVVAQAYHLWLQYEVRTDDITMIALYLGDVPQPEAFAPSSSFYVKSSQGDSAAELAAASSVTPPAVKTVPSTHSRASVGTAPKCASSSRARQWLEARLPRSRPAAPSSSEPVQMPKT